MTTNARIHQLPPLVANQIAAGEVIERPASVVKELLENALDANADTITIEIAFGGLNQVKVSDNGMGIVADDLSLAIAAHATSKITQLNDLYAITSMGFRGEALASIAAVAKLTITSKPKAQPHAMMLTSNGALPPTLSPCARTQGTTIDVRDLFFNAPVRKKFLKTPRSEYQAIEMVVKRFALSAPHIALTLKHDGKQMFTLPAAVSTETKNTRIKKLLGKTFIDNAIYLDVEQAGMRLQGWISTQSYQRSQNDKQWIYINQRMVKDKLLHHAIKQAYEGILDAGRYPACVLYLTIAPMDVDVNVHPTKHEVRFQQPRLVHDFITSHLSATLKQVQQGYCDPGSCEAAPSRQMNTSPWRLNLYEGYVKKPLRAVSTKPHPMLDWFILNSHFALIIIDTHPYLVDIHQVHQQWLFATLTTLQFPLTTRPLLVPIRYAIDQQFVTIVQDTFQQIGIEFDCINNKEIVIRTLPVVIPQLDIKKLVQKLEAKRGLGEVNGQKTLESTENIRQLLANCQTVDAHQLSQEDKALLQEYLQNNVTSFSACCLRLDRKTCQKLIGVGAHA